MPRRPVHSLYGRLFARLYDRLLAQQEEAGLRRMRADLLSNATGRVLEIGAGTGLNIEHYPDAVEELVLAEPEAPMARQLHERVAASPLNARVLEATGESLPLPDDDFDTVVSTLVLCTTPDPAAALAEAARVLKPGGRLLFLEHVRSGDPKVAKWQDRLYRPWRFLGHGCNCNRDTLQTIEASPLTVGEVADSEIPKAPPIVRPLIIGEATAA